MNPDYGPSHILGDHSAGSYRRWFFGGGFDRAREREQRDRCQAARALWHRVHGQTAWPPGTVSLTNYAAGKAASVTRECWESWDRLRDYIDAEAALLEYLDEMTRTDLATLAHATNPEAT